MNWKLALNGAIAGAALLVAACGGYGSTGTYGSGYGPTSSSVANPAGTTSVALRSTPLGQIIVDGTGRTLYLFAADKSAMSTCYGDCASVWPPSSPAAAPWQAPASTSHF